MRLHKRKPTIIVSMSEVTIYHNPSCSKSRATLALLEERGIQPRVILYLEDTPDAADLERVVAQLGIEPRALLRVKEAPYSELGLDDPGKSAAEIIQAMCEQPILIERPIVVSEERAVIGRPPENVLEIL